ncbi:hypothetical protein [Endozoicomonas lisbonensis]|uniref:hypothetical protein n=1 Tax=Endozoicomonas lisbonensis TaxID=3120522 RepID=UPI003398E30F
MIVKTGSLFSPRERSFSPKVLFLRPGEHLTPFATKPKQEEMTARERWKRDYELARVLLQQGHPERLVEARIQQMGKNARAINIATRYVPPMVSAWERYQWEKCMPF